MYFPGNLELVKTFECKFCFSGLWSTNLICSAENLRRSAENTYWIVCSESTYFDQLANTAVIDIFTIVKYGIFILFLETEMNGSRCINDLMNIFSG